jgi:hypothetical protein
MLTSGRDSHDVLRAYTNSNATMLLRRFEALHASEMTALLGREEELELLLRRWAKAKTGGQLVLLSGEAGGSAASPNRRQR